MALPPEHQAIYNDFVCLLRDRHQHLLRPFLALADAVNCDHESEWREAEKFRLAAEGHVRRWQSLERELADARRKIDEFSCIVEQVDAERNNLRVAVEELQGEVQAAEARARDNELILEEIGADGVEACGCRFLWTNTTPGGRIYVDTCWRH